MTQKTHSVSVIKTNQLMLYSEIIAVCSDIHTKHTHKHSVLAECETGDTLSKLWALKGFQVAGQLVCFLFTQFNYTISARGRNQYHRMELVYTRN
jgi:hypothetical protein